MKTDKLFIGLLLVLLAACIYLLFTRSAKAQDGWLPASRCEWKHGKERCSRRHHTGLVEYYWTDRRRPVVHYRQPEDPRCHFQSISATGEERYGLERAKEAAAAQWMERVRFLYGVRYMDPRNARHASYECGRSSTGNRASEKTADLAGRFLEQCELKAEPCKAEKDRDDK